MSMEPCLVCSTKTKGIHFQVTSCRACAAFFRRSSKTKQIFRCQRGTKNCGLTKAQGRSICRYCRLKKCKEVGMILTDNDEDVSSVQSPTNSYQADETKPSHESAPSTPTVEFKTHFSSCQIIGIRWAYDAKPLCDAIKRVLNEAPKPIRMAYGVRLNFMQELQCAYNEFLENFRSPPSNEITIWEEFPTKDLVLSHEMYLFRVAEMLVKCEQYAELSFFDKYLLFKHFWQVFQFSERVYMTSVVFGTSATDLRMLITESAAIDFKNKFIPIQGMDLEKMKELQKHINPINDHALKHFILPLKTMKLSQYEFIYFCSLCLWTVHEIKGKLSENAIKLAEDMFEQCSNDMHNYYVYEERQTNYASRISKINKLHMIAEDHIKVRKELGMMAKLFQLLESDFCDCELMEV